MSLKKMSTVESLLEIAAENVSRNALLLKELLADVPATVLQSLLPYLSGRLFHELNQIFVSKGIDTIPLWRKHIMMRWSKIHKHSTKDLCQDYLKQDACCPHRLYMESHFHDVLFEFLSEKRISKGKFHLGNIHPYLYDIPLRQLSHRESSHHSESTRALRFEDLYDLSENVYCLSVGANICEEIVSYKSILERLSMSVICLTLVRVRSSNIAFCEVFIKYLMSHGALKCLYIDFSSDLYHCLQDVKQLVSTCSQQIPACQTLSKHNYYCSREDYDEETSLCGEELKGDKNEYSDGVVADNDTDTFDLFDEAIAESDVYTRNMQSEKCLCPTTGIKVLRMNFVFYPSFLFTFRKAINYCFSSMQSWLSLESVIFSQPPFLESIIGNKADNSVPREKYEDYSCLLAAVKKHRLHKLELEANVIFPGMFESILFIFNIHYRTSNGCKPMTCLSLTKINHRTEKSSSCISSLLESNEKLSAVKTLNLSEFLLSESSFSGLLWLVKHDTALTTLILKNCCFIEDDINTLLETLADAYHLEELDISGTAMKCESVLQTFVKLLKSPTSKSLKVLGLEETNIPGNFICGLEFIEILTHHPSLECINLRGNMLGKFAVEWIWMLFESGNPVLKSVNISENVILGRHVREFIDRMQLIHQQRKTYLLSSLDLTLNDIFKDGMIVREAPVLRNQMKFIKSLTIDHFPNRNYWFDPLADHLAEM